MDEGRFLAFDVGAKRIGVAASDPEGILASAIKTIHRKGNQHDLQEIQRLIDEFTPRLIIFGLPITLRGEIGEQARKVMEFAQMVNTNLGIPFEYLDERLTTVTAERMMVEAGIRSKKRREKIDSVSAVLILQAYLDSHPRRTEDKS